MKQVQYDSLLSGEAKLNLPDRSVPYSLEAVAETSVVLDSLPAILVTLPHHVLFPIQYTVRYGPDFAYCIIGSGRSQDNYHDVRLECACGGELTLWDSATDCNQCGGEWPALATTMLEKHQLHERRAWLHRTRLLAGRNELEAAFEASVLEDLLLYLDACADVEVLW